VNIVDNVKNIGLESKKPEKTCTDKKCPFHGDLKVRGREFTGKVVSAMAKNTAKVMWDRKYAIPKYERYEMRRTKLSAHNPECINAQKDDIVRIVECRKLSKTKNFVIIEKLGRSEDVIGVDVAANEKEAKSSELRSKSEKVGKEDKQSQKPKKK
jgi:small subunit ribosomal protein S17